MIKVQGLSVGQVCKDPRLVESVVKHRISQSEAGQAGLPCIGKPITAKQQRIRQLESKNRQRRGDVERSKKSLGLLCPRTQVCCWLDEELQKKAVSVIQACQVLQASYRAARMRIRRVSAACAASVQVKRAFAAGGLACGNRRLCAALQQQGVSRGRHRIRTPMQANELRPV